MMNRIQLNQENLSKIGDKVSCPTYNRKDLKNGIVHIGVGGFHRAHEAFYLHELMEQGDASDWGIVGVGIREGDRKIHDVLNKQDGLYTLLIKHPDGSVKPQVIGSINDFVLGTENPEEVIKLLAAAEIKIVSLTITEGGYNFNPSTGDFDFENTAIIEELKNPEKPKTVYGFLAAGLRKRRDAGLPPFTIMSCDNIQHNGDVARQMLLAFLGKLDPELAKWVEEEVSFPNSMVDRITPVTSPADIDFLTQTFGIKDEWPVTCEPFIQWVIEDNFSNGRPDLEKVGVQFVTDVKPYEKMKLRLLNAGHSVLGILGAIHGHKTINACMNDAVFVSFLRAFLDKEASPVLDKVEGIDLEKYKDSLQERFANPNIKDTVSRICSESSAKLPKFLIATLHENLSIGGSIKFATFLLAAWCYYSDKRIDKNGDTIEVIDAMADELHGAASRNALTFIKQEQVFGELAQNERFTGLYLEMVGSVYDASDIRSEMERMV